MVEGPGVHPSAPAGVADALPLADASTCVDGGRTVTTSAWCHDPRVVAQHVLVDQLGHAWSGGDPTFPYNDAAPPDATALLGAMVRDSLNPNA